MKKFILIWSLLITLTMLSAQNWRTYTNTSHVYDADLSFNGLIFSATWGGVNYADRWIPNSGGMLIPPSESSTYTTRDGLSSNDIRTLTYITATDNLWLGSSDAGITIISPTGVQVINDTNGLPSNKVRKILEKDSMIYVATDLGLSVFSYLEGVSFPLLRNQYNYQNTAGGLANNDINDMILADNGYLYLSTDFGISYVHTDSLYQDSAWANWNQSNSPVYAGVNRYLSANSHDIIIGAGSSVNRHSLDPTVGSWTTYYELQGIENHSISDVCLDEADNIWVSYGAWDESLLSYTLTTDVLLTRIDVYNGVTKWYKKTSGLTSAPISAIKLKDGEIFLCSWGSGVFSPSGNNWDSFQPSTIGFPKIAEIATDHNNVVWLTSGNIGTEPVRKGTMGVSRLEFAQYNRWATYNQSNSPIITDNVISVAVDSRNRKWFGTWDVVDGTSPEGWMNGLVVYDDTNDDDTWTRFSRQGSTQWNSETNSWQDIPNSIHILGNTIAEIAVDMNNNVLVACSGDGVSVLNSNDELIANFTVPTSTHQQIIYIYHSGDKYFFGTKNDPGIAIWNDSSLPATSGEHWLSGIPSDLRSCLLYGVVDVNTPYEGRQFWLAASTGLYMWDETNWYRYDTAVKRLIYNNGVWDNETLYYADEERLFGSVHTTPTSIYLDHFNRIWIGSLEHGITKYDPKTERFTNYYMGVAPLLSNYITSLGYEPKLGLLLIGTPDGLNTVEIGTTWNSTLDLGRVVAYPNPFQPSIDYEVKIENLPYEKMPNGNNICRVYDSSGALVAELSQNEFSRFTWNGTNKNGKRCSSGIYFFVVTDQKGYSKRGKIALIR